VGSPGSFIQVPARFRLGSKPYFWPWLKLFFQVVMGLTTKLLAIQRGKFFFEPCPNGPGITNNNGVFTRPVINGMLHWPFLKRFYTHTYCMTRTTIDVLSLNTVGHDNSSKISSSLPTPK
jgi:hypothetical protein